MISCTSFSCSCEIKKRDYPLSFYLCHTSLRASVCVAFVEWSRACFCSSGGVQQRQLVVVPPPHLHTHTHLSTVLRIQQWNGWQACCMQPCRPLQESPFMTLLQLLFSHLAIFCFCGAPSGPLLSTTSYLRSSLAGKEKRSSWKKHSFRCYRA